MLIDQAPRPARAQRSDVLLFPPRRGGASHEQVWDFGILGMWYSRVPQNHHDLHPLLGWKDLHVLRGTMRRDAKSCRIGPSPNRIRLHRSVPSRRAESLWWGWASSTLGVVQYNINVRVILSVQWPTLQQFTNNQRLHHSQFKLWFVSSEFLKCSLLKCLLAHPMKWLCHNAFAYVERRRKRLGTADPSASTHRVSQFNMQHTIVVSAVLSYCMLYYNIWCMTTWAAMSQNSLSFQTGWHRWSETCRILPAAAAAQYKLICIYIYIYMYRERER